MTQLLMVGFGGFFGSISRYLLAGWVGRSFPQALHGVGTITVNLLGCFAIGLLGSIFTMKMHLPLEQKLLLITGFLGGFTTFSAFGLEAYYLYRSNEFQQLILYLSTSLIGGMIMVAMGMTLAHWLFK